MNIIVLGPPGSGKGTQAKQLAEALNFFYFEAGDFARELAKKDSRIDKIVERGDLIPEQEMTKYVSQYLKENVLGAQNIVFDGYPRFLTQYKFLEGWLDKRASRIDKVFLLEVSDKEVVRRISARRICHDCGTVYNLMSNPPPEGKCECGGELIQRKDDTPEAIKERLKVYKENVLPMVAYIEKEGLLQKINGERPIQEIFQEIFKHVGQG